MAVVRGQINPGLGVVLLDIAHVEELVQLQQFPLRSILVERSYGGHTADVGRVVPPDARAQDGRQVARCLDVDLDVGLLGECGVDGIEVIQF